MRNSRKRVHFDLGPWVTLVLGIVSLLVWMLLTAVLSRALVASVDRTLGIDWGEALSAVESAESKVARSPEALDAWCRRDDRDPEEPLDLVRVEDLLEGAAQDEKALFRQLCSTIMAYRDAAVSVRGEGEGGFASTLPMIRGSQELEVRLGRLDKCTERLGENDLGFFPVSCLLDRLHGVGRLYGRSSTFAAGFLSLFLLSDSSHAGLQGNVYDFGHSRAIVYEKDPSEVAWLESRRERTPTNSRALQIQTLQQGLNRFDKIVLPHVKALEASVWSQRFLLRILNHPFQFVMFWLGAWAAMLYGEQLRRIRWGRDRSPRLAEWLEKQVPFVQAPTPAEGEEPEAGNDSEPYSPELRNLVDSLLDGASVRGRAIADTISEWIPMLGFIGTVFGMIGAMEAIGEVIAADQGPELYVAMGGVTSRLSLAFYTTFVGLVLGLALSLLYRLVLAEEHSAVDRAVRVVRGVPSE